MASSHLVVLAATARYGRDRLATRMARRIGNVADARAVRRPEPGQAAGSQPQPPPQPPTPAPARPRPGREAPPVRRLVGRRTAAGLFTLCVVSVLVFAATEVLPGNAANAVLGRTAASSPAALHRLGAAPPLHRGLLHPDSLWVL